MSGSLMSMSAGSGDSLDQDLGKSAFLELQLQNHHHHHLASSSTGLGNVSAPSSYQLRAAPSYPGHHQLHPSHIYASQMDMGFGSPQSRGPSYPFQSVTSGAVTPQAAGYSTCVPAHLFYPPSNPNPSRHPTRERKYVCIQLWQTGKGDCLHAGYLRGPPNCQRTPAICCLFYNRTILRNYAIRKIVVSVYVSFPIGAVIIAA